VIQSRLFWAVGWRFENNPPGVLQGSQMLCDTSLPETYHVCHQLSLT
jgi:hypothetical protein